MKRDDAQIAFDTLLPHSIADMLQTIMRTVEVEDFEVIEKTLKRIKTVHKLKSVLRAIGRRPINNLREKTGPGKPGWEQYQMNSGNALKRYHGWDAT